MESQATDAIMVILMNYQGILVAVILQAHILAHDDVIS